MNDEPERRTMDRRDQSDLIETLDRNSAAQIKAAEDFTRELTFVKVEMTGIHEDTEKISRYFVNGFKQDIIDANAKRADQLSGKLNLNTILLSGCLLTLVGMLAKILWP